MRQGLVVAAAVVLPWAFPSPSRDAPAPASGYLLQWDEGEKMIYGPRQSPLNIKVSPKTGSQHLIMGTSELAAGTGIPVHMHEHEDELLFVHRGEGTAVVGDRILPAGEGATIFVPRGTWHAVENAAGAKPIQLLWIFPQPGVDGFFRELSVPIGGPPRQFSPREIEEAGRKHGVRRRIPAR